MGKIDSKTFATLNLMLGTLQGIQQAAVRKVIKTLLFTIITLKKLKYLSLDAVITIGNNSERVISEPITGASREIAWSMVIRYK